MRGRTVYRESGRKESRDGRKEKRGVNYLSYLKMLILPILLIEHIKM
jgi:hypothetical protein